MDRQYLKICQNSAQHGPLERTKITPSDGRKNMDLTIPEILNRIAAFHLSLLPKMTDFMPQPN